jgi:hypothetical protein
MAEDVLPVAEVALLPNRFFIVIGAAEDEWDEVDTPDDTPATWNDRFALVTVEAQRGLVRTRLWDIEPKERVGPAVGV